MKKPRKWPVRARKHELVDLILAEVRKRSKIEGSLELNKLPLEDIELLAMAFGYRDPEARASAERRAEWQREGREREEARREAERQKRLPPPPKALPAPEPNGGEQSS